MRFSLCLLPLGEKTSHQLVGVGTTGANIHTRVSTKETLQRNCQALPCKGNDLTLFGQSRAQTTGTSCGDNAEILAIHIDHFACGNFGIIKAVCSVESHFLGRGKQTFERRVRGKLTVQERKHNRYGNAIIGTEGGAFGAQKVTVNIKRKTVFHKIDGRIGSFYANHIGVTLEHQGCITRSIGGCRLFNEHVVQAIAIALQASLCGKSAEVIGNLFLMVRGVRNGTDILKKAKNRCGFAILNEIGHNDFPFGSRLE